MTVNPLHDTFRVKAAGKSVQMKKALLLDRQSLLMLQVAETYFQVLHSEKQKEVLTHSLDVDHMQLTDIRLKEKAGMARPMDVSLARAKVAKTRSRLIQAENDVKNSRAMLAYLIGVPEIDGPLVNGLEIPAIDWQTASLPALAHAHRQDLIFAHEQVSMAAASLEAAWGEYFPSVSLNLSTYLSKESFPDDVAWTSLIRINLPIFSAGLIHADVRSAYSRLRQANLYEIDLHRQVVKDIKVTVENLNKDTLQIDERKFQVQASKESFNQTTAAVNAGLGTNLERLIAQDGLLSAELSLASARFNRDIDYLRLLHAAGVLHPDLSLPLTTTGPNDRKTKE